MSSYPLVAVQPRAVALLNQSINNTYYFKWNDCCSHLGFGAFSSQLYSD